MSHRLPNQGPTQQSVFKIIFVKLATLKANIYKAQGDFLRPFARCAGSVGKMLQRRSTTYLDTLVERISTILKNQAKQDPSHIYQMPFHRLL